MLANPRAAPISLSERLNFFGFRNNGDGPQAVLWRRGGSHKCSFISHGCVQWPARNCSTSSSSSNKAAAAGYYSPKPIGTPGSYQLHDNQAAQNFIALGGMSDANDDDDNNNSNGSSSNAIPQSTDILSRKPFTSSTTASSAQDGRRAINRGLARSFGRFKSHKVSDLVVRKTYRMKKDANESDYDSPDVPLDRPSSSHLGPESLEEQKRLGVLKDKRKFSNPSQLLGTVDMTQNVVDREDKDHPRMTSKHRVGHVSKNKTMPTNARGSDTRRGTTVSRVSATLRGWGNGESALRYHRTDISKQGHNVSIDSDFYSRKSFGDLGCSDFMIESLKRQLYLRPSRIQAMAFTPVIGGKSCILSDQSGSGKTLAYLVPVIQRLRLEELQGVSKSSSKNPRVVILVPTTELASQVLSNCRSMSKSGVPFRSMVATGGFRQKTQLESLQQDLDVLIATPGRFIFLIKEGFLQLTNLRCAVLDEVDILFNDEEFETALQSLIISSPVTTQYLFVTATLPVNIYNKIVEVFPDCEVIMGPGMHRTSSGLEEILVDCSGEDGSEKNPDTAFMNKKSALLQLVEESPVTKTIVFCNKIETCRKVENALKRFDKNGIRARVLPFHAAVAQESRLANMEEFCSSQSKVSSLFFVCTDRASRGIDFSGVDHVVLFDFPRDPNEYVRRVGRTARGAGGKGKSFLFVVGKQVSLARRIIERNRKGHPLHDVPSSYEWI